MIKTRVRKLFRGLQSDPSWVRPALLAMLAATALLYLWDLSASGWANGFYSAAVQAGSVNWEAFFFGSSDAANSITVDKTPASLWIMALSVRLFGLSSWSILAPQALMGVATVGLVYLTVRRSMRLRQVDGEPAATWTAPAAGLIAGVVTALTPVAVLMFKFNNPDALLVLLLVAAAYALVRACEYGSARWMALCGALIGFGFLAKMMQAFLVLPIFGLIYLCVAPNPLKKRIVGLVVGLLTTVVAAGWWVAIVELIPADKRPYIGGSQNNSIVELILGYNGLGRLTGNEVGSVGGGGGPGGGQGGGWGETGVTRMFNAEIGGQVSWLIPAALILGVASLWLLRKEKRTDSTRTGILIWGGWLVFTGLVFSFMSGIFHAYYTVALAPAIGAMLGMSFILIWEKRSTLFGSTVLGAAVITTAVWSFVLLGRSTDFLPWLRPLILVIGVAAAAALCFGQFISTKLWLPLAIAIAVVALAGPTAYSLQTTMTGHEGSIPTAGPTVAGGMGGPGGRGGPGAQGGRPGGGMGGGMGGLLMHSTPSEAVTSRLLANASDYTWVAAAIGSQNASGYQLATGEPVMAIGGFNGSDPSPTLEQFKELVAQGKIHYFIGQESGSGGGMPGGGSNGTSSQISNWVTTYFEPVEVDGVTMYDLSVVTQH